MNKWWDSNRFIVRIHPCERKILLGGIKIWFVNVNTNDMTFHGEFGDADI
jgi:hypothetical protein